MCVQNALHVDLADTLDRVDDVGSLTQQRTGIEPFDVLFEMGFGFRRRLVPDARFATRLGGQAVDAELLAGIRH
jgi:hypothetical protein